MLVLKREGGRCEQISRDKLYKNNVGSNHSGDMDRETTDRKDGN